MHLIPIPPKKKVVDVALASAYIDIVKRFGELFERFRQIVRVDLQPHVCAGAMCGVFTRILELASQLNFKAHNVLGKRSQSLGLVVRKRKIQLLRAQQIAYQLRDDFELARLVFVAPVTQRVGDAGNSWEL